MELIAFYFFAGLAVVSALFILFTRNLMYAAFGLFLTFMSVAALYVFAMADFLAVSQIMIYVGGVLVLLVFGIMLTHQHKAGQSTQANYVEVENGGMPFRIIVSVAFFLLLIKVITGADFKLAGSYVEQKSTLQQLGIHLMTSHLLPFEIIAVLLLAVLLGAGYMAFNRIKNSGS
ncbi:MAG: NADH-quinone oxidoreductase subunit J [Cytophagaceae bacterium SCN 52-12]|nr:MAG: NADH-quinone oxidoreductase subunit J [Cytophagaceae bacterium SCN 52-12]